MRKCSTCKHYSRYYEKGGMGFLQIKQGYCRKHAKITFVEEECVEWESGAAKRKVRELCSQDRLSQAVEDIREIKQILKENREEAAEEEKIDCPPAKT